MSKHGTACGTPRVTWAHIWGLNWPAVEKNPIPGPCRRLSVEFESRRPIVIEVIRKADPNKKVHLADAEARLCCITLDYNPYYCPRCLFLFDYKTKLITNVRPKNLEGNNTVAKRASYIPMSCDSIHPRAFSTFDSRGKNNSNNNLHVIIL